MAGQIQPLDAALRGAVISTGAAHTSESADQCPFDQWRYQVFTCMQQIMKEKHPKELWNPPRWLSDLIYLETSLTY